MASGDARRMLPIVARAFAELGYRRTTTAELARRCGVRENVLYRAWPSKKEMFLATIDFVWEVSAEVWQKLAGDADGKPGDAARRMLEYESRHHGELGLHRVIYAGLTETDDPEIAAALRRMYNNFHAFIVRQLAATRASGEADQTKELAAWALIGIGHFANIGRELRLISDRERGLLYTRIGEKLIQQDSKSHLKEKPD